jgi:hypothetical protein
VSGGRALVGGLRKDGSTDVVWLPSTGQHHVPRLHLADCLQEVSHLRQERQLRKGKMIRAAHQHRPAPRRTVDSTSRRSDTERAAVLLQTGERGWVGAAGP